MRVRLVLNFGYLMIILYGCGAFAFVTVFQHGLDQSMDALLVDLAAEVRPSIAINQSNTPTLSDWAKIARAEHLPVLATIQIFSRQGQMLEAYGPKGVNKLEKGRIEDPEHHVSVRSVNQPIMHQNENLGTLQVQVSTKQDDRAVGELGTAILMATPVVAILVAVGGYIFSGLALRPVEQTMELLRRFVADAGHELKTPISVIEAAIETLEAEHKEHHLPETEIDMIRSASARMKGLTADLMFLAKVEDPMRAFDKQVVNLKDLLQVELEEYSVLATNKNISLTVDASEDLEILAEPESFRQLLSNLLSNAIKYNEPGGKVSVSLLQEGNNARITVTDTGFGIPESSLSHIYERFYRADKSRSRDAGGAGLGLAIVKAVADAHEARVQVTSKVGQGTSFVVYVPLRIKDAKVTKRSQN